MGLLEWLHLGNSSGHCNKDTTKYNKSIISELNVSQLFDLIKSCELESKIQIHLNEKFSDLLKFHVMVAIRPGYISKYMTREFCVGISIMFINGYKCVEQTELKLDIYKVLKTHLSLLGLDDSDYDYVISLRRGFSDSIILRECRKYADCIQNDLPINMHNIHCFKVGNVTLYDLAVGELELMEFVEE
jgi:hypothetical protein